MCLIIFVVFGSLCVNEIISGSITNAMVYGAISLAFGVMFGWRIYVNREKIFRKHKKED